MPLSPELLGSVRSAAEVGGSFTSTLGSRTDTAAEARLNGFRTGREEGFKVGAVDGRRLAEENLAQVVGALEVATLDMQARCQVDEPRLEALAIELAVELAEAIVGGNLALVTNGDDVVARALRLRRTGEPLRIRLHPDDAARVEGLDHPGVELVSDPQLAPGIAHADVGEGFADISIETALARIREELA